MTPNNQKRALSLYRRYQTESREYREIAERNGLDIGGLNRECHRILRLRRQAATATSLGIPGALLNGPASYGSGDNDTRAFDPGK